MRDSSPRKTGKVLIVDDDPGTLELMQWVLQVDDRITVLTASDGEAGLSLSRQEQPDLILLDVVLPNRSGYAVCSALKHDPATKHAMVILLSAMGSHVRYEQWTKAGADAYVTKPFSPKEMLALVRHELRLPVAA
ncbi:MAG: response regulator [Dehalococcoidia bacterium]